MTCLNIPNEWWYDPENMFLVGLIPGPDKPSLDEINHGIKPLVDDLLDCWDPGLFISHSAMRHHGRRVLAALIPLVCDILGARQTGGFSGVTSTLFCSFCYLTLDHIENFDMNSWKLRDGKTHRRHAQAWRDAKTPEERDAITREFGVRDSELLRLPYWDPITCTILDSMHTFFLNTSTVSSIVREPRCISRRWSKKHESFSQSKSSCHRSSRVAGQHLSWKNQD